ncbi:hypothetical protein J6590_004557 [Homalodisca vitripennis]|nr:hypothetical protein J6590_004557 [Homalodisca vitripennis]
MLNRQYLISPNRSTVNCQISSMANHLPSHFLCGLYYDFRVPIDERTTILPSVTGGEIASELGTRVLLAKKLPGN